MRAAKNSKSLLLNFTRQSRPKIMEFLVLWGFTDTPLSPPFPLGQCWFQTLASNGPQHCLRGEGVVNQKLSKKQKIPFIYGQGCLDSRLNRDCPRKGPLDKKMRHSRPESQSDNNILSRYDNFLAKSYKKKCTVSKLKDYNAYKFNTAKNWEITSYTNANCFKTSYWDREVQELAWKTSAILFESESVVKARFTLY